MRYPGLPLSSGCGFLVVLDRNARVPISHKHKKQKCQNKLNQSGAAVILVKQLGMLR